MGWSVGVVGWRNTRAACLSEPGDKVDGNERLELQIALAKLRWGGRDFSGRPHPCPLRAAPPHRQQRMWVAGALARLLRRSRGYGGRKWSGGRREESLVGKVGLQWIARGGRFLRALQAC